MKKLVMSLLAVCSICAMSLYSHPVSAIDFSKNENKYIKICSSSSLSRSQESTCRSFNSYLAKKNKDLKADIASSKQELSETNDNIDEVTKKVNTINKQIAAKEKEINYLLSSIKTVENNISKKEQQMRDRLYVMQTTYNSNWIVDFLFGSDDFSTFFSRLNNVNDITSYEKELVEDLNQQKADLSSQKQTLLNAKASLQSEKNSQVALQKKLTALKEKQKQEIANNEAESKKVSAAQQKIDDALSQMIANDTSGSGGSYVSGSSDVGNKIAQAALTRLGCRYYWGATGPSYFDCSGLVYWACNQAGVGIGRSTASGYSGSGKAISRGELQAGDIITFSYGSGVAHVGIYIGGGSFVHAAGLGSGTVGQYADQCVKTSPLAGYWSNYVYNYRRLY